LGSFYCLGFGGEFGVNHPVMAEVLSTPSQLGGVIDSKLIILVVP
jgi:hypothetical protein